MVLGTWDTFVEPHLHSALGQVMWGEGRCWGEAILCYTLTPNDAARLTSAQPEAQRKRLSALEGRAGGCLSHTTLWVLCPSTWPSGPIIRKSELNGVETGAVP